jgi:hypothetical protein
MSEPNYFEQLVGLLNEEELIRLKKRSELQGKVVLVAILAIELVRREEALDAA